MTIAERIQQYTAAAAKTGLPIRSVVVEGKRVEVKFGQNYTEGTPIKTEGMTHVGMGYAEALRYYLLMGSYDN